MASIDTQQVPLDNTTDDPRVVAPLILNQTFTSVTDSAARLAFRAPGLWFYPVLLVSIAAETPYASTLAGLDLSPSAAAAVRAARKLAPGAKLTGFHAVHVPYAGLGAGGDRTSLGAPFLKLAQADLDGWIAANQLGEVLDEARIEEGGLTVAFARMVSETKPQLVAIGAHGRGGLNPTLLGRFAAELLRDPPCDLLVVRR